MMSTTPNDGFVLIVDDNPTNLAVLTETLSNHGFRFRVAVDGESALALAQRNRPELILLDVQMPGIDGFETCRRLKGNPATQKIPVLFTTALTDPESKTKGFSLGAVDYIPKPFSQTEVIARIRSHLQLKQMTETLEQQVRDRTTALQQTQIQLVQQEKLATLGELIAGIAHEINNPINFVSSNLTPLRDYIKGITEILRLYQDECPAPSSAITDAIEALDLDFVLEDIEKILGSFELGTSRIKSISTSLRTFSRSDQETKALTDLHQGLDSTLMILKHRLKGKGDRPCIEVIKSYGTLPEVSCYPGQLNQVFMNLLANAIDALEESLANAIIPDKPTPDKPTIFIRTEATAESVVIAIADNGGGVPESIQSRLFEPLFTTKAVGKGTGLGLSITRQIVVDNHGGTLELQSQPGQNTEFVISIPLAAP